MNSDIRRAQPSDVFGLLPEPFGITPREVALYGRHLREDGQDLWPMVTPGRGVKFEVRPHHATALLIGLASGTAAAGAAERARFYSSMIRNTNSGDVTFREAIERLILDCSERMNAVLYLTAPIASLSQTLADDDPSRELFGPRRTAKGLGIAPWMSAYALYSEFPVHRTCIIPGALIGALGRLFKPRPE